MSYAQEYERSLTDPEGFWREKAELLPWFEFPETILDQDPNGAWRWFRGGKMNSCWLALDRHVEAGRGEQNALIYDSPATSQIRKYTYSELTERVSRVAGALQGLGVGKGDRVIVYMPMVPEAAIAMLACARLGAIHSVVFGGFAAPELATRIDDATPKVILSAS
ncbi:MAG: AMP-binding protein, partial [Gammaproteobacteria bacterium]|nr:AMP-binding protein [Gammaproteobacteria bacterium]